jgi:hypothetical protein
MSVFFETKLRERASLFYYTLQIFCYSAKLKAQPNTEELLVQYEKYDQHVHTV